MWLFLESNERVNAETGRKFHFIRIIASGGFGSVYLAKELHSDGFSRVVAVKLLHPKWSENEEIASRMRDEARLLGQIRHRHIVDVRDLTRIDGRVAVVMEYLEAIDLKDIINGCLEAETTVPVRAALELGGDVASALDAAYNRPPYAGEKPLRVIHRDIKPSNVMVDDQGNAKVLDFGVARADFQGRESETQELAFGSVEYMPPERLFFEPESPASDIYSLGATLYELLARAKFGKAKLRPALHDQHVDERLDAVFAAHPPGAESIRDEVDLLLTEMLSFDEADRPSAADCATRMRDLAGQLQGEPTLSMWSKSFVPPLVAQAHAESESSPVDDALSNRVMEEDSKGFARAASATEKAPPEPVVMSAADIAFEQLKEESLALRTPPPVPRNNVPPVDVVRNPRSFGVPPPPPRRTIVTPKSPPGPVNQQHHGTPATEISRVERPRSPAPKPASAGSEPPRTAVMARPARRPLDDERFSSAGSGRAFKFKATVVAFFTAAIVAALFVLIGSAVYFGPGFLTADGSADVAAPRAADAAIPAAPELVAAQVISGPSATFESALPGTRKVTVRCDEAEGEGDTTAVVAGDAPGDCTVTAMDSRRRRLTAVVTNARAGAYTCFADGESVCEMQ
jgi:serine/threonine protein kinase